MSDVVTNTGKVFPTDYHVTIPKPAMLFIRILNTPIETVREVFGNPEETATLNCGKKVYEGYTILRSITDEGDAKKVVLKHG